MKINKIISLLIIFIFGSICAFAQIDLKDNDVLQIRKIRTCNNKIIIGNKSLGVLDKFKASDIIKWSPNCTGQYIKVCNMRTKMEITIGQEDLSVTHTNSVSSYIRERYMYDKGQTINDFADILEKDPRQMYDNSLRIFCPLTLYKTNHYFLLTQIPGGNSVFWQYDDETNELYVSLDYLTKNGIFAEHNTILTFSVSYVSDNDFIPLTNKLEIHIY